MGRGAALGCWPCARARWWRWSTTGRGGCGLDYRVPARGLVGFRTEFLTETRGTGRAPPRLRRPGRPGWASCGPGANGSMVADPPGRHHHPRPHEPAGPRGRCWSDPGVDVYEGMVIGENARADEMDVNPTKERKLTNVRSSTAEELERLTPSAHALARAGPRVHRGGRYRRGHPRPRSACERWSSRSIPGSPAEPGPQCPGRPVAEASSRVRTRPRQSPVSPAARTSCR